MPGPDALDEPLSESQSTLKSHRNLPRKRLDAGDIFPAAKPPRQPPSTDEQSSSSQLSIRTKSPLGSPIVLSGESALPPTPPSNSREHQEHYNGSFSPLDQAAGAMISLASKGSGLSTPTNGRSPPTPDITPPSVSTSRLRLPLLSPDVPPMSRTESFQTAREEQWSSDEEPDSIYGNGSTYQTSTQDYIEATKALRYGDRGLGFEFEREDDATPRPEPPRKLPVQDAASKLNGLGKQVDTSRNKSNGGVNNGVTADWDDNVMRNVTLRRIKRPRTPPRSQHVPRNSDNSIQNSLLDEHESPQSFQSRRQITRTPPMDGANSRVASGSSQALNGALRDIDAKRLSGLSSTSTVVEAVIRIATPPSTRRTLRHVSKYTGLRTFSGSSIDMSSISPTSASNRTSLNSDDVPLRKLNHKRASIGEKRNRDSLCSEADTQAGSNEPRRPLKHHRDYSHLRPSTASSSSTAPQVDSSQQKLRKVGEFDSSPRVSQLTGSTTLDTNGAAQATDSSSLPSSPTTARRILEGGPRTSPKVLQKEKPAVLRSQPKPGVIPEIKPKIHSEVLPEIKPMVEEEAQPEINPKIKPATRKPEKLNLGPFPITPDPPSPLRDRTASQSSIEPRTHLQPLLPIHSSSQPRNIRLRGASDASNASDDARRVSFDDGSVPNEHLDYVPRRSADSRRSISHSLDDGSHIAHTPHLYPPVTPLSMSSVRSEVPEVSEAKTVNIYPHNNESLLVIQHGGSPTEQAKAETLQLNGSPLMPEDVHHAIDAIEPSSTPTPPPVPVSTASQMEEILHLTPPLSSHSHNPPQAPQLLIQPSTPTSTHQSFAEIDSPLRNPRKPPQPPAFKLIPPTPFSELDSPLDSASTAQVPPQAPVRRFSLKQHMRRYSDSFIQPLFSRTGSLKRNFSIKGGQRPMTEEEQNRVVKDTRLHPLWRPRGFWDDFSDSDSDDGFWGDGELTYADDGVDHRLPEGGDTSEVRSLEHQRRGRGVMGRMGSVRKVMEGFRGSGGFLIGNSLGMERAGTNRRRHHISLPVRLQDRVEESHARTVAVPNVAKARPPSHINDYNGAGAAHLNVQAAEQNTGMPSVDPGTGGPFTHNATQPLSLRSRSNSRDRSASASMSLSSFPSSYTSTSRSGRKGWRRKVQFPFRIEYVGVRGLADRMREKKAEKRRDDLRKSIGRGVLVQGSGVA